jgi:hypothetical protein
MDGMSEQPSGPDPAGIQNPLDSGLADRDHQPDSDPTDARGTGTVRTDPDDPEAGMKQAQEASEEAGR